MPVNLAPAESDSILPVAGVRLAIVSAGVKQPGRRDVVLVELAEGTETAAVFTRNAFCAAPVILARQHLKTTPPRYLLINSGNANAGTGEAGMQAALTCCKHTAMHTGLEETTVLPFSTGVIGQALPVEKITAVLPEAINNLSADNWYDAAHAIMTTDTLAKVASKTVELDGRTVTITGMSKGAGMIRPDMATLLAYIATDAAIEAETLKDLLQQLNAVSFNRISVDGDTSTNDACVLMATGQAGNTPINDLDAPNVQPFVQALRELMEYLAQAVVRDGEGATKFITLDVSQGRDEGECKMVAYTIAHSPLVKTALFASDPNWGRILAAVGRSGLDNLDLSRVNIYLGDVCIVNGGQPDPDYTEDQGQRVMQAAEITIRVELGRGDAQETVWSCDFSYDYVKINAEYRT